MGIKLASIIEHLVTTAAIVIRSTVNSVEVLSRFDYQYQQPDCNQSGQG